MNVSHNEVVTLCQKVYEGLGLDVGAYEDAGELVGWLSLHGLDGLSLFEASTQQTVTQPSLVYESETVLIFDLQQSSSLATGVLALDFGYAKSKSTQLTTIHLQQCTQPLLLAGALVRCAKRGIHVFAHWHDETPNGVSECVMTMEAGQSYPTLHQRNGDSHPSAMTIIW